MHKIKCGIFDFNANKWDNNLISKEKFVNIKPNECGICANHEENEVVLVDQMQITGTYNFYKEKWHIFDDNDKKEVSITTHEINRYRDPPTIWFDNEHINLLYCAGVVNDDRNKKNVLELSYLDTRDNKKQKKWTIINDKNANIYNHIKYFNSIF